MTNAHGMAPVLLLVEDDNALRQIFSHLLRREGYQVYAAATCEEAKELIGSLSAPPNIVLSDYALPDGDGLLLRRWLWSRGSEPKVFLLVSGSFTQDLVPPGVEFLAKPFSPKQLCDRLYELLHAVGQPVPSHHAYVA
ncbi:MAG TPA: response regulator [Opitutaceae bacterium]|nr:response regulator [Opitutaceae bacterium]